MHVTNLVDKLPKGKGKYKDRLLSEINTIVVHHSLTQQGSPEAFARFHITTNKYPSIGYHYVIGKSGTVFKTQLASTVSWHADNYNRRSIGICLVGNYDIETPPTVQMEALYELCQELIRAYSIKHVIGHREVPDETKSCPGKNIDLEALRDEVFAGGDAE